MTNNSPVPLTSSNTKGIFRALIATAMFAAAAALAKITVVEYHVLQILFFRQVIVFLSSLPSITQSFPASVKTSHPITHSIRLAGAFTALSCGIWAVAVLPLTVAITIGFAQVFIAALLAAVFLKESVGPHRILTIVIGFIGVVIVIRPGLDGLLNVYTLIPLLAATGAAVAVISVRKLSQTDSTATLLLYQSVLIGVLAGIPLIWLWETPDLTGLIMLVSIGLLATIGQWAGVQALRLGEASVISSIQYTQLIYVAALGFVLFDELPDKFTLSGAAIIIASAIYLLHHETHAAQKAKT